MAAGNKVTRSNVGAIMHKSLRFTIRSLLALAVLAVASATPGLAKDAAPTSSTSSTATAPAAPAAPAAAPTTTQPKSAPTNLAAANKGVAWLVSHQLANGGFGQGEESSQMGGAGGLAATANVADTAIAALALLRSGSTPKEGTHKDRVMKAVDYVLKEVEASDEKSIFVTQVRGTRVQSKLGQAIDTFMAIALLTELEGKMPNPEGEMRLDKALRKALNKVQKNQRPDGSFEQSGWAPVLSQGVAVKGLATASAQGYAVDDGVQAKAESYSRDQVKGDSGFTGKGAGSAGIGLYGGSANTMALQSTNENNERERKNVEKDAKEGKTEEQREKAKAKLKRFDDT